MCLLRPYFYKAKWHVVYANATNKINAMILFNKQFYGLNKTGDEICGNETHKMCAHMQNLSSQRQNVYNAYYRKEHQQPFFHSPNQITQFPTTFHRR